MATYKDLIINGSGSGSGSGGECIYYNNSAWKGVNSETDIRSEKGKSLYANTSTTLSGQIGYIIVNSLQLGNYTLMFRLKSANISLTANSIQINIQKNIDGVFTTQKTYILKPTDFDVATDYKCFYTSFEYKNGKAKNNEIRIMIDLLKQTSYYKINLDYIQISPTTIGVFE